MSIPPTLPPLNKIIRIGLFGVNNEDRLLPKCVLVILCDNELLLGSVNLRREYE